VPIGEVPFEERPPPLALGDSSDAAYHATADTCARHRAAPHHHSQPHDLQRRRGVVSQVELESKVWKPFIIFVLQALNPGDVNSVSTWVQPGVIRVQPGDIPGSSWNQDEVEMGSTWDQPAPPYRGCTGHGTARRARQKMRDGAPAAATAAVQRLHLHATAGG
jgi:hypothetical protein